MKIMHVCKKYPRAMGGDAVVVANLVQQQRAAGHIVTIVTSNCDEIQNSASLYKFGLKDTPAGLDAITMQRLLSLVLLFFKMFIILRKEKPHVIHAHSIDMAFIASFAAHFYGIPLINTFHIVTFYDDQQSSLRRKSEIWLAKKARLHFATAPNKYDVRQLHKAGLKEVVLLSNGVGLNFWKGAKAEEIKEDDTHTFVAIGRLEIQKGYEYLIPAAALLAGRQTGQFRLIIVGEGSQIGSLRAQVRELGLEKIVLFAGQKTPQEIKALFSRADAVVVSSLYETTPLTLLEAWAAGVPVIATSVGILRDIPMGFGAAYVVPPKDEYALMQAMAHYIENADDRRRIAQKGAQEVKKYDWPIIARNAETMYWSTQ